MILPKPDHTTISQLRVSTRTGLVCLAQLLLCTQRLQTREKPYESKPELCFLAQPGVLSIPSPFTKQFHKLSNTQAKPIA